MCIAERHKGHLACKKRFSIPVRFFEGPGLIWSNLKNRPVNKYWKSDNGFRSPCNLVCICTAGSNECLHPGSKPEHNAHCYCYYWFLFN